MSDTTERDLSSLPAPELYVRVNITKNTKGYSYERTVSMRWPNQVDFARSGYRDSFVVDMPNVDDGGVTTVSRPMSLVLAELLEESDNVARAEIARCEALDRADAP